MARKKGTPGVAEIGDPQEDAFLRAIMENLEDDTPRLVYSDWLQERGNPWGEFIRCQVLADQKKTPAAQKKKHAARAGELMAQHKWLPSFIKPDDYDTKVERGFLTSFGVVYDDPIMNDDSALAQYAANPFFALTPAHVSLYDHNPMFSIIARVPRIGSLGKIDWESCNLGCLEEPDSESEESFLGALFLGSPHLAGLRELRLAACGLKNKAVEALANNPALSSLRSLDIGSDHGMEVSGNYFDDKGVKALAESPHLNELEELVLSDSCMGDKGLKYLCGTKHLPKLKKLDLDGVNLTDKGYQTLGRSPFASRLTELIIGKGYYQDNGATDLGAMALAASPYLDNIQRLELKLWGLAVETVQELQNRFGERLVHDYD